MGMNIASGYFRVAVGMCFKLFLLEMSSGLLRF